MKKPKKIKCYSAINNSVVPKEVKAVCEKLFSRYESMKSVDDLAKLVVLMQKHRIEAIDQDIDFIDGCVYLNYFKYDEKLSEDRYKQDMEQYKKWLAGEEDRLRKSAEDLGYKLVKE